jgi:hypothetical protein
MTALSQHAGRLLAVLPTSGLMTIRRAAHIAALHDNAARDAYRELLRGGALDRTRKLAQRSGCELLALTDTGRALRAELLTRRQAA